MATSVNTTILGQAMTHKPSEEWEIFEEEPKQENSYEKSIDKCFIRKFDRELYTFENEPTSADDQNFSELIKIVESQKKKNIKSLRVASFSPVANYKTSLGAYYSQNNPDSFETRIKSKPYSYFTKSIPQNQNESSKESKGSFKIPVFDAKKTFNPSFSNKNLRESYNQAQILKPYTSHLKYKTKKYSEGSKVIGIKYTNSYTSKRPKSAKSNASYTK